MLDKGKRELKEYGMNRGTNESLTMTYSSVVTKDKKRAVCVRFERLHTQKIDYAEAILPECDVVKQEGFTAEEILQLEEYLKANRKEILEKAKGLSNFMHWFK